MAARPEGVFSDCPPITFEVNVDSDRASQFTFYYFAMKGRGEIIRMILEEAQVPHHQCIWWVNSHWQNKKKAGTPFGMLPVLELANGQTIAQSSTITRYLAQITGLDGGPTISERVQADMVFETAVELKDLKTELATGADHSDLQSMIEGRASNQRWGKLLALLTSLDRILSESGSAFFVGEELSYADIAVFNSLNHLEAVKTDCLSALKFQRLVDFRRMMASRPRLSAYLASDRCYPFTELEIVAPGHESNGQPMGLRYVQPLKEGQWQRRAAL